MRIDVVARALAELLKIFGALGIVNLFTLSMLFKSTVELKQVKGAAGGQLILRGDMQNQIRDFSTPDLAVLVCGAALVLMFIRLFYGSMILLEGEYINNNSKKDIHIFDFLSVILLMPLFSIMSMYAGTGNMRYFFWFLEFVLFVDVIVMYLPKIKLPYFDTFESVYKRERNSWTILNSITAIVFLILYVILQSPSNEFVFFYFVLSAYCAISVAEIATNWQFYFLGRSGTSAISDAPSFDSGKS